MNEIMQIFNRWKKFAVADSDLTRELQSVEGNFEQINDRFYRNLQFGTAGIRGIIGAGTNRMNVYVVGRATQALGLYLNSIKPENLVVIGYDNRIKSWLFAKTAAQVLAANGIRVKIFKTLKPVPVLSYAVRELGCDSGIMITASHNPAEYNGYKVYGNDGCQIVEDVAEKIYGLMKQIDVFSGVNLVDFEEGQSSGVISYCDDEIEQNFLNCVEQSLIQPNILQRSDLKLIYTPLNGSGMEPITRLLKKFEISSVHVVEEQKRPDGNFPTCKSPNPELLDAFSVALSYCKRCEPDVVIATDPDCDRIGVVVKKFKHGVDYELLNGNQLGVLMLNYICSQRIRLGSMPQRPIMFKTIVSTPMVEKIAQHYNVEFENVLTGFKYIGQKIAELEQKNEQNRFIFAFEESQGYLAGSYVRDKDGVFAAMLICEMVVYYSKQNKTLFDVLNELYDRFGYFKSSIRSYVFEGENGMETMLKIMQNFRTVKLDSIGNFAVEHKLDYLISQKFDLIGQKTEKICLPKSNVVEFRLTGGSKIIVRVSGTEPKVKTYYTSFGKSAAESEQIDLELSQSFEKLMKSF